MQATDIGAGFKLDTTKQARERTDDAFQDWLRLQDKSRRRAGNRSGQPPKAGSCLGGPTPGQPNQAGSSNSAVLDMTTEAWVEEEELDMLEVAGADLEELLEAVIDEREGMETEGESNVMLGAGEPSDATDSQAPARGDFASEEQQPPQMEPNEEAIAVVDAAAAVLELDKEQRGPTGTSRDAASASGNASPPADAAEPFPPSGFVISELGYVRCNRPGHDPAKVIGLVGLKRDGKSIFANCHLHAVCSVSAGVMRKDVPPDHMADWLCQGTPAPPGATTAERKALGVEHRRFWRRP